MLQNRSHATPYAAIMDLLQWRGEQRTPRGQRLREQLCALTGAYAPFPHGQQALARLVQDALVLKAERVEPRDEEPDTAGPTRSEKEEEPTAVLDVKTAEAVEPPQGKRAGQGGREE